MKLASFSYNAKEVFGVVEGDMVTPLGAAVGLADTLAETIERFSLDDIARAAAQVGAAIPLGDVSLLPPIPHPSKIFCVGVNYETHRLETGRDKLGYPIIFLRVADSQVGHDAPMVKPRVSEKFDYEGEIALVIGKAGRDIPAESAYDHVFGYSCYNDGSVRDWQFHTSQWGPGKNFAATGAFGPWLVTPDELGPIEKLKLETRLNGETLQSAYVDQMIFSIPEQIAYLSTIVPLRAGDVIVTGTPGGVGVKREPQIFMKPGDVCEVEVSGIGILSNPIVAQNGIR